MSVIAGGIDFAAGPTPAWREIWQRDLEFVTAERQAHWHDGVCALYAKRLVIETADRDDPLLVPAPGGVVVAIDGHLYNLPEMRRALGLAADAAAEAVVAAAWEKWGDGFAGRLNGEFALIAWNPRTAALLLAVDHVASVPLYWAEAGAGRFVFATELSAVIDSAGIKPEPDWAKVADYLASGGAEPERTFIKNAHAVAPGTVVVLRRAGIAKKTYWIYGGGAEPVYFKHEEGIEAARAAMANAVAVRLSGATNTASHLTGGLDSTAVSAFAAHALAAAGKPLQLYSIGPWLPGDERASMPSDADYIPAFLRDYPQCAHRYFIGENGPSIYPLPGLSEGPLNLQLTKVIGQVTADARQAGCRVILNGWGGEASLTYYGPNTTAAALRRGEWRWLANHLRTPAPSLSQHLRWIARVLFSSRRAPLARAGVVTWPVLERTLQPEFLRTYHVKERCFATRRGGDPLRLALNVTMNGVLRQGRLACWRLQGRAEGFFYRYPLLDRLLLDTIQALPPSVFVTGRNSRELVRHVCGDWMPREIFARRDKSSPMADPATLDRRAALERPDNSCLELIKDVVAEWPRHENFPALSAGPKRSAVGMTAMGLKSVEQYFRGLSAR